MLSWLPALASAAPTDDLPGHAGTFTVVDGILIFGVAPVGVFLLVALVVMRPGSAPKAQRYRPGRDWTAAPSWSGLQPRQATGGPLALGDGGREDGQTMPVMDGAHDAGHSNPASDAPRGASDSPHRPDDAGRTGGASGSW